MIRVYSRELLAAYSQYDERWLLFQEGSSEISLHVGMHALCVIAKNEGGHDVARDGHLYVKGSTTVSDISSIPDTK
jgi:hypothetical protein